jgi:cysteinyl-tRNA synthetase
MDGARTGLRRLLDRYAAARRSARPAAQPGPRLEASAAEHLAEFDRAICDDLNTPRAVAAVIAASRDERVSDAELAGLAGRCEPVLAIGLSDLQPVDLDLRGSQVVITEAEIESLLAERASARIARDFSTADALRDQLADAGVIIEDLRGGESAWRWA